MKFGKSLRNEIAETLPQWKDEFIAYKELKKQLKLIVLEGRRLTKRPRLGGSENFLGGGGGDDYDRNVLHTIEDDDVEIGFIPEDCLASGGGNVNNSNGGGEEIGFMLLLDSELEKVNTFFIEKEEEYIIRMKELKDRVVANREIREDMTQVKVDILEFHGEMVLLLHYSVLNFAGLLKIVKKHKKKTGTLICSPFMPKVLQQPFFTTDLVCNLLKECEVMLNQLFPANDP